MIVQPLSIPTFTPDFGHPLNRGLVGWWLATPGFNGYGSQVWRDISGRQNHGTLTSMDAATDWVSLGGFSALDFDGSDDNVLCTSAPLINATSMSVIASVYTSSTLINNKYCPITSKDNATGNPNNPNFTFQLGLDDRGGGNPTDGINISVRSSAAVVRKVSNVIGELGWYHIGFTYNEADASLEVYLNGKALSTTPSGTGTGSLATCTNQFKIGRIEASGFFFPGAVNSIRAINRPLSAAEMAAAYLDVMAGHSTTLRRATIPLRVSGGAAPPVSSYSYLTLLGVG